MEFTTRATLRGSGGAVSAGHYLATQIGAGILADGGNAADAACAMGFALQVLEPTQNGPAGEVPILVYDAGQDHTFAISGQGPAPAGATREAMGERGIDRIPPDGFLAATVPAALDAWCRLLEHFGTRRLADVLAPARGLAQRGFPMYPYLRNFVRAFCGRFEQEWPTTTAIYLPLREIGERQTNPALARFCDDLIRAERAAGGSREAGIRAARDHFYRGRPAEQIDRFLREPVADASGAAHAGLLTADDLAAYEGAVEEPVARDYRGACVWKCPPWSQGPVFLQQLALLEGFDLRAMGRGSAEALHTWIECAKLAFADRDACYGDPRFVEVPLATLLAAEYAETRRRLIDPDEASLALRPGMGRLPAGWPIVLEPMESDGPAEPGAAATVASRSDTTQLVAADAHGNLVSATPSGGWILASPVVPELGFPVGTRAQMFVLDSGHPNALEPGKRPRTTLSPSLAQLPDGRRMAFGTPGGDQQDQWSLQFFLGVVDFGVEDLQEAIDDPTVHSLHMPCSFFPRNAQPGVLAAEARFAEGVLDALWARGHRVVEGGPWDHGRVLAVTYDPAHGSFEAAASPRAQIAYAGVLP
jgi:gamma-glutamyltranspeptidase/glutathione hydrolase